MLDGHLEDRRPGDFDRNGYIVVRDALSAGTVLDLAESCKVLRETGLASTDAASREGGMTESQRAAHPAQFAPSVIAAVRRVLGDVPVPLTTTFHAIAPYPRGRAGALPLNPHTHNLELITDPIERFVFVWLALQDIALEQGPMWVSPGSHHRLQDLQRRVHDELSRADPGYLKRLERGRHRPVLPGERPALLEPDHAVLRRILEPEVIDVKPVLIRKGDAVLFHPALLHGTMPPAQRDGGDEPVFRLSCVTWYVGRSCKLYANPPWAREPHIESRYRLPDRYLETHCGRVYDGYTAARLRALNLVATAG